MIFIALGVPFWGRHFSSLLNKCLSLNNAKNQINSNANIFPWYNNMPCSGNNVSNPLFIQLRRFLLRKEHTKALVIFTTVRKQDYNEITRVVLGKASGYKLAKLVYVISNGIDADSVASLHRENAVRKGADAFFHNGFE